MQRILIKWRCAAFRLQPVETAAAYRINEHVSTLDGLTNLFLYSDAQGRWRQDSAVFSGVGTGCLERSMASGKELILLDELGGIELGCTGFMEAVRAVLDSSIPVLGVYKAPRNAAKLAGCLGDGSTGSANRAVLDYLQSHPDRVYTVNAPAVAMPPAWSRRSWMRILNEAGRNGATPKLKTISSVCATAITRASSGKRCSPTWLAAAFRRWQ